jgi:hypothetical protein
MRAVVIPPDGPAHVVEIDVALKTLQGIVGGYIEAVALKGDLGAECFGYINEEGKLDGLAPNPRATEITRLFTGDYIAGTMIVMGQCDTDGVETSVPEHVAWAMTRVSGGDSAPQTPDERG